MEPSSRRQPRCNRGGKNHRLRCHHQVCLRPLDTLEREVLRTNQIQYMQDLCPSEQQCLRRMFNLNQVAQLLFLIKTVDDLKNQKN